jgi:hypothetical protein
METKYGNFYEKVLDEYEYGADRLPDLFNICKCAEDHGYKLTWEVIKNLLDNPTELLDNDWLNNL